MWRQVRALSPWERARALEILVIAAGIELGLRLLPLQRLLVMMRRLRPRVSSETTRAQLAALPRLTAAILRRSPFRMTCLKQTLVLFALLRRRNLPAALRIGLAKTGDLLQAHAWIEHNGRVLLDDPDVARRFPGIIPLVSAP